jgi:hypothetical protein
MRTTWAVAGILLLAGCSARSEPEPGSENRGGTGGNPNGGTGALSGIDAGAGSGNSAPPVSSSGKGGLGGGALGESGQGGATLGLAGDAGGPAESAGASGIGSACGRVSLTAGSLSPRWEVVAYNSCVGDDQGFTDEYHSIWSDGANRVWIAVWIKPLSPPVSRALIRWEDGDWYSEISGCQANVVTIHGITKSNRWFTGCGGLPLRSDGGFWDPVKGGPDATRVWVNSATDVWTCCEASASDGSFSASHWNGSSWTAVPLPSLDYKGGALWSSGPHDVWIADKDVLHWNGTTWQTFNQPDVQGWQGVWGDGANVWAVGRGSGSEIARYNGVDFEALSTSAVLPEGMTIKAAWGSAPNDVWFVGLQGAVVHWNGTSLERESTGLNTDLLGVWGAGGVLWVSGTQETLMKRTLD